MSRHLRHGLCAKAGSTAARRYAAHARHRRACTAGTFNLSIRCLRLLYFRNQRGDGSAGPRKKTDHPQDDEHPEKCREKSADDARRAVHHLDTVAGEGGG